LGVASILVNSNVVCLYSPNELFLNFLLLLCYLYANLVLQMMMNQMNIFVYTPIEIIIYFNWIRSLWDRHSYFKIIIL